MIAQLQGRLVEKHPTELIIDCAGVGYEVKISLNCFSALGDSEQVKVFTKLIVREDAHLLYGFHAKEEREMFNHLISVSGIGPNTAMIMLSSMVPEDIAKAIQTEDVVTIQKIKGIGAKTAQRVIIDLKGKVVKLSEQAQNIFSANNTNRFDALTALVSLGFDKKNAEKAIEKVSQGDETLEQIIKGALKIL
jgi:Holliday junction DNA helicase RuvA